MHNLMRLRKLFWDGKRWTMHEQRRPCGMVFWCSLHSEWDASRKGYRMWFGTRFTSFSRAVAFAQGAK